MSDAGIEVPYHRGLGRLERVLSGVRRAGDFVTHGSVEVPMPRVEVEGVGVLSFPVPAAQVRALVRRAERAPYGRGGRTIVDTSVRKVWQLPPSRMRITGKSWDASFQKILAAAGDGLGCAEGTVAAKLYKLLVYDGGGFFRAHRDTEKADGMFGTLVVVLPSAHRGGALVVRHAGREVTVDLGGAEGSELAFAAFYADCEHEVRPITRGNRVCLVYTLLQRGRGRTRRARLTPPLYEAETAAVAGLLGRAFAGAGSPAKLAWLLKHQYSPAGLSFAGLKGEDRARAGVLREAAERAGCAVHLGIVHIEEYGAAEPDFDYLEPRARWRRHDGWDDPDDDEDALEDESGDGDFEVIEVSDASRYIDHWIDPRDRRVAFGKLPVAGGEVLPAGALDGEAPDEQRFTEATGNEGASFERAYHRAALVVWPRDRFADVLLQAGAGAVLPHLAERVRASARRSAPAADRARALAAARRVVVAWEGEPAQRVWGEYGKEPGRGEMLAILGALGDLPLLERFIAGVVTKRYDGSENEALARAIRRLDATAAGRLLSGLAREHMRWFAPGCVDLLWRLAGGGDPPLTGERAASLRDLAAAVVEALPQLTPASPHEHRDWQRAERVRPVDATVVVNLFESLAAPDAPRLRDAACDAIAGNTPVFDPATVLVPALGVLRRRRGEAAVREVEFQRLWDHAADFLLARSEHPPEPPEDWRQPVTLACRCADCRELQAFALDPLERVHRFPVRKERRQHLHETIDRRGLDMTHVTERKGSPQTLVCTKTLRTFEHRCEQHRKDVAALAALASLVGPRPGDFAARCARIAAARRRAPRPFTPP